MKKIIWIMFVFPLFSLSKRSWTFSASSNAAVFSNKASTSSWFQPDKKSQGFKPLGPWTFSVLGTGNTTFSTKTNAASITPGNSSGNAGELIVVVIAKDNQGTSDGDNSEVNHIQDNGATAANIWVKAVEFTNSQGSASAGATISIWYTVATENFTLITIVWSSQNVASSIVWRRFSVTSGNTVAVETSSTLANDNADAGSIALSGMTNREHLIIRGCALENNTATGTNSANYTVLSQTGSPTGTTGASAASNMWLQAEFRIITSTSETTDPTTGACDNASAMVAFYETSPSTHKIYLIQ